MILPLPVKKNKFGERVADLSVDRHYRQIAEEIIEACTAQGKDDEVMELVDVITCCVTRLDILQNYDDKDFSQCLRDLAQDFGLDFIGEQFLKQVIVDNFYPNLVVCSMQAYSGAVTDRLIGSDDAGNEETYLIDIIYVCVKRLEYLGYDESAREKLYQAVNNKNRRRGYFEDH